MSQTVAHAAIYVNSFFWTRFFPQDTVAQVLVYVTLPMPLVTCITLKLVVQGAAHISIPIRQESVITPVVPDVIKDTMGCGTCSII